MEARKRNTCRLAPPRPCALPSSSHPATSPRRIPPHHTPHLMAQVRQWLRNSAYAAYFTLAVIRDLPDGSGPGDLGGLFGRTGAAAPFGDPEAPTRLAGMVEAVAPGEAAAQSLLCFYSCVHGLHARR